jgi:elongation factor P--beta-lysine ligase
MAKLWLTDKAYYAEGALGIERLIMLATEQKDIDNVVSFIIKGA